MSQYANESERLHATITEYRQTVQVLAVVTEQLLKHWGREEIVLSDKAIIEAPDIVAWRDEATNTTHIRVER